MKDQPEHFLPKENLIQKILAIVSFQGPFQKFQKWLDHKLKHGVFELQGDEVVSGLGRRPDDRIRVSEIRAWQIHGVGPFDIIAIELIDGRTINWRDKYNDLIAILHQVAADRELPWTLA